MMPGATRLLQHFKASGVPMAVATSTPRSSFNAKMSGHSGQVMRDAFAAVVCGDEVGSELPCFQCADSFTY
jgi:beta-phosphoglucomutase-like phosphatase (HAD superfamily)